MNTKIVAVLKKRVIVSPQTAAQEKLPYSVKSILKKIDFALANGASPIAAFDADGTVWRGDMGETFFRHIIKNNLVPLPANPWQYYQDMMREKGTETAYLWLAQIFKGLSPVKVREWATESFEENPPEVFSEAKQIIAHLRAKGVEVYIVTASVQWAIEPAAEMLGIPVENIIGIKTKVVDGLITDIPDGPITYKDGKVEALLQRTGDNEPFFCAGNTPGDFDLLVSASHFPMVMASAGDDESNFISERKMIDRAKRFNWFYFDFVK